MPAIIFLKLDSLCVVDAGFSSNRYKKSARTEKDSFYNKTKKPTLANGLLNNFLELLIPNQYQNSPIVQTPQALYLFLL